MGCELLRQDQAAYQSVQKFIAGFDDGKRECLNEEWARASGGCYLSQATKLPIKTVAVETETEKRLFGLMEPHYRTRQADKMKWDDHNFKKLASDWNKLCLDAYHANTLTFEYRVSKFDTHEVFLKDEDDFRDEAE